MLTQREAATACGVSRSTIRRRREDGDLPGCVQDPQRGWLIPVDALLAAGFKLNAPAPPDTPEPAAPEPAPAADVAALRAELSEARHAAELAAVEAEYLRRQLADRDQHLEDLRTALRALTPAPERAAITPGVVVPEQAARPGTPAPPADAAGDDGEEQPRRRWWGGRR
ncbi:helix-turn-helix domain-containing protein [Streptomyces sp. NPDC006339]|uniref:helix-turn-helix transcriptional regulator n=1 Tax=Streptomyces sp. NPDC006339 TaxID=3156755 RepID=UPI0033BC56C3